MPITARPVPIRSDNYAWWLVDEATGTTAFVDPADAQACIRFTEAQGGKLGMIILTHHHDDHIAGVEILRDRFGAMVVGNEADQRRLPPLNQAVKPGGTVMLGETALQVIDTPGHTRGHVSYYAPEGGVLLCADTLFSLGCGKLLEGTPAEMFESLRKLAALPDETLVCPGHEYTATNARFALSIDPGNEALQARAAEVERQRAAGEPTVPTTLGAEREANPFLRAPDVETLADIRSQKDDFR